jgi:DNA-binding transcriptional LysR family regulator
MRADSILALEEFIAGGWPSGQFLSILPSSMLRFSARRLALKVLPVKSPVPPSPVGILTLKNRAHNPVTQLLIACAREVVKPLTKEK